MEPPQAVPMLPAEEDLEEQLAQGPELDHQGHPEGQFEHAVIVTFDWPQVIVAQASQLAVVGRRCQGEWRYPGKTCFEKREHALNSAHAHVEP